MQNCLLLGSGPNIGRHALGTKRGHPGTFPRERHHRRGTSPGSRHDGIHNNDLPGHSRASICLRRIQRHRQGPHLTRRRTDSPHGSLWHVFRFRRVLSVRQRTNGHVLGDGIVPAHSHAVRHHLADRGHASDPANHRFRSAIDKKHGKHALHAAEGVDDRIPGSVRGFHQHPPMDSRVSDDQYFATQIQERLSLGFSGCGKIVHKVLHAVRSSVYVG